MALRRRRRYCAASFYPGYLARGRRASVSSDTGRYKAGGRVIGQACLTADVERTVVLQKVKLLHRRIIPRRPGSCQGWPAPAGSGRGAAPGRGSDRPLALGQRRRGGVEALHPAEAPIGLSPSATRARPIPLTARPATVGPSPFSSAVEERGDDARPFVRPR